MSDAVQPRSLFVHCRNDPPRSLWNMGSLEHVLFGEGVVLPAPTRFEVHRTEFPLLHGILQSTEEAYVLLMIRDREPVLYELNARPNQHAFEFGHRAKELFQF